MNRIRFPSPVRAGARLRGRFELVDAAERNGAVQVVERFTVELDSGDKPACVAEVFGCCTSTDAKEKHHDRPYRR